LQPEKSVRLPLTNPQRSQPTYAKLLQRVDPRSRSPFEWAGRFLRPGATVPEASLWPDGTFPRAPLILEFAGALNPGRGHNRRKSDETAVLWRYDRAAGKWVELGRVAAPGAMWGRLLEPLVRNAMAEECGFVPLDCDLVRSRIARVIAAELALVADRDRAQVLTLVHDELASRISEWGDVGEGWLVGCSSLALQERKPTN
jgi:hypothetical protein